MKEMDAKVTVVSMNLAEEKIHLLQRRLGRPFFTILKNIYPDLFGKLSMDN